MNVSNTHSSPIALPNGLIIQPGKTVEVKDWDSLKTNKSLLAFIDQGILKTGGGKADKADATDDTEELDAAGVLALADDGKTSFPAFRAAAEKILGEDTPSKKADIVEALKAI